MYISVRNCYLGVRLFIWQLVVGWALAVEHSSFVTNNMPATATGQPDMYDGYPGKHCVDIDGKKIEDGNSFTPSDDPCKTCHCQRGSVMCVSVQCSPPACKYRQIPGECCKFVCLSGGDFMIPAESSINKDLGVRVIATAITSLLILLLLIFMIHRLHRRHVLIANRRMNAGRGGNAEDDELAVYMTNIDHIDHPLPYPYQDLPPPYTPRKSSEELNEAPPPYQAPTNGNAGNVTEPDGAVGTNSNQDICHSMPGNLEPECGAVGSVAPASGVRKADIVIAYGSEYGVFCVDDANVAFGRLFSNIHKNIVGKPWKKTHNLLLNSGRRYYKSSRRCAQSAIRVKRQIHRSEDKLNELITRLECKDSQNLSEKLNREQELLWKHQVSEAIPNAFCSDAERTIEYNDDIFDRNVLPLKEHCKYGSGRLENVGQCEKALTKIMNKINIMNETTNAEDSGSDLIAEVTNGKKQNQNCNFEAQTIVAV